MTPFLRPRFLVANTAMLTLVVIYWRLGVFTSFPRIQGAELVFVTTLAAYGVLGLVAAFMGGWQHVSHIANSATKWGLVFTGLSMVLAFSQIRSLTGGMLPVIQSAVFALVPNITGMTVLAWLNEVAWWTGREEL